MTKRKNVLGIIGGIFLLLQCISTIWSVIAQVTRLGSAVLLYFIPETVSIVGCLFVVILLFMGKNNKLLGIALCVCTLPYFYLVISSRWVISSFGYIHVLWFIVYVLTVLLLALLSYGAFVSKKSKLSKLTLLYAFVPTLICFIEIVMDAQNFLSTNLYGDIIGINFRYIFFTLFKYLGWMVLGLNLLDIDDEKILAKIRKFPKLGIIGLPCFIAGIILPLLISGVSLLIFDRIYFFDGFWFTGVLWILSALLLVFGMISMPFFFLNLNFHKKDVAQGNEEEGYIDMTKHILLLLFTFGIWQYIWIYRTTLYLNRTPDSEQENPTNKVLLCMFVPFYSIYWIYKHGQRVDTLSKTKNPSHSDISNLCLILSIFIPFVSFIIMQDRINTFIKNKDVKTAETQEIKETPFAYLEELKQIKELLDTGIITQEEFDIKKKRLLGL